MGTAIFSNLCPDRRHWHVVLRDLHQGDTGNRRLDHSSPGTVVHYLSQSKAHTNARLKPGVAIGHTVYAVYHLVRSAKERTPASSASYMIFAAFLDAGLIPFFVFSAIMSRTQYTNSNEAQAQWQTLFNTDDARFKIVFSNFLFSVVDGSLHLISFVISIYLATIFRQISKLPPDMNPLEDNLTSRHKRNKSSLVDNRTSQQTTSTAMTANLNSKAEDGLISPPRTVPFLKTRADSLTNLADIPYPDSGLRTSRVDLPYPRYDEPPSKRSSIADIGFPPSPTRPTSADYINETRPESTRPPSMHSSRSTAPSIPNETENWTTHPSPPPSPFEFKHLRNPTYQPLLQTLPYDVEESIIPHPLEMNPPTPPNNYAPRRGGADPSSRVLVAGTGNMKGFGVRVGDQRVWYEGLGNGKRRGGERVVSRTGAEVGVKLEPAVGIGRAFRAREVSGKVVEEGRGDGEWI